MPWTLIIPSFLLFAGCITVVVFSKREGYRLLLKKADESAEDIVNLTCSHVDIYERLYALIFFFANDLSGEKQKFAVDKSRDMQDVFDTNILVDLEISRLFEKAHASEKLIAERSVSLKNLTEELEEYEKNYAPAVVLFNQRVSDAHRRSKSAISKKILSGLGTCSYQPIVFPR
ncbi:MAG: hypothetical protein E7633_07070 [Ruminococcaceae bacterium]|nr:hypothetical protein [Oscillospiraceae bacterium]